MQLTEYTKTLKFHVGLISALHLSLLTYFFPIFVLYSFALVSSLTVIMAYIVLQVTIDQYNRSFDTLEYIPGYK